MIMADTHCQSWAGEVACFIPPSGMALRAHLPCCRVASSKGMWLKAAGVGRLKLSVCQGGEAMLTLRLGGEHAVAWADLRNDGSTGGALPHLLPGDATGGSWLLLLLPMLPVGSRDAGPARYGPAPCCLLEAGHSVRDWLLMAPPATQGQPAHCFRFHDQDDGAGFQQCMQVRARAYRQSAAAAIAWGSACAEHSTC